MSSLKIDGKEVTVASGTTIIEAAEKAGVFIPRYCYHPGLSIAGNCRMCLVEVEKMPKLQIACYTPVSEGMAVRTQSERVKETQAAILEFLLANHPLDCPVCDQAGECELQNYYMKYGLYDSRFSENKVKKPKVVPVGPTVMLDAERCILCSRCVRFTNEITKTHEFGIVNRGDHAEITAAKPVDNLYSGNVVDICPVGALTDRDFRFKCRVWFLEAAPSVCPGCSQGCNIEIHWNKERPYQTPGERVMRLKPRFNPEVNQWWICDGGRYGYHFIDQDRLLKPQKRGEGVFRDIVWEAALEEVSAFLARPEEIGVMVSTDMTNEDLWMAKELFVKNLGVKDVAYHGVRSPGKKDDFLIKSDKSPNTCGAQVLGFQDEAKEVLSQVLSGKIKILFVFGHRLTELFGKEFSEKVAAGLEHLIFIGSNRHELAALADWILPSSVYAEKEGTFVNVQGRVQRIFKAFAPLGEAKAEWEILQDLGRCRGLDLKCQTAKEIFDRIAQSVQYFEGMSYEKLGMEGKCVSV